MPKFQNENNIITFGLYKIFATFILFIFYTKCFMLNKTLHANYIVKWTTAKIIIVLKTLQLGEQSINNTPFDFDIFDAVGH